MNLESPSYELDALTNLAMPRYLVPALGLEPNPRESQSLMLASYTTTGITIDGTLVFVFLFSYHNPFLIYDVCLKPSEQGFFSLVNLLF